MSCAPVDVLSSTSCAATIAPRHNVVDPVRHCRAQWSLLVVALVIWLGVIPAELLLCLDPAP